MTAEYRLRFRETGLGEGLSPTAEIDFRLGRIEFGGRYYHLSGRIPPEVQAAELHRRGEIIRLISRSLKDVAHLLLPNQRHLLTPLFPSERSSPITVGFAARLGLAGFNGRLSSVDEKILDDSLKKGKKEADVLGDQAPHQEMLDQGRELIVKTIKERANLLCLFALGGFFVCPLKLEEERAISWQGRLLVPVSNQNIPTLSRSTESAALYLLHKAREQGGGRVFVVPPAEWVAFINYRCSLASPRLRSLDFPVISSWRIRKALGIIKKDVPTPWNILSPSSGPKSVIFGRRAHSQRSQQSGI